MVSTPRAADETASVAGRLLRGALLPIVVVGVLAIVISTMISRSFAASSAVAVAIAMVAFSIGPMILKIAKNWPPPAVMGIAMLAYMGFVGISAVVYLFLLDRSWLSLTVVGWTLLVCVTASTIGIIRASSRLRILAFGSPAK